MATENLKPIEKLEFVQNMFKTLGLDFTNVTIDQAFSIYHDTVNVIESNLKVTEDC